jgi:hypothetical protein
MDGRDDGFGQYAKQGVEVVGDFQLSHRLVNFFKPFEN